MDKRTNNDNVKYVDKKSAICAISQQCQSNIVAGAISLADTVDHFPSPFSYRCWQHIFQYIRCGLLNVADLDPVGQTFLLDPVPESSLANLDSDPDPALIKDNYPVIASVLDIFEKKLSYEIKFGHYVHFLNIFTHGSFLFLQVGSGSYPKLDPDPQYYSSTFPSLIDQWKCFYALALQRHCPPKNGFVSISS